MMNRSKWIRNICVLSFCALILTFHEKVTDLYDTSVVYFSSNAGFGNLEVALENENVVYAAQPDENTIYMLDDQGFDVVINLRGLNEDIGFDEEKLVLEQDILYQRIPYLNDDEDRMINNDALTKVKLALEAAKENNHKVLIHCSHGYRAASTLGLLMYRDNGYSAWISERASKSVGMQGGSIQRRFDEFVERIPQG